MHWTVWGTGEIKEGKSVSGMAKNQVGISENVWLSWPKETHHIILWA